MRPFFTLVLVCFLIGGMYGYLTFADSVKRPDANHQSVAETKKITVEIKRSSSLFADPGFDVAALKVEFKNQLVANVDTNVPAQDPIIVELPNAESGLNTVNVLANFQDPQQFLSDASPPLLFAIEVVVFANDVEIAKQLFSSSNAAVPVGGQISFDTQRTP